MDEKDIKTKENNAEKKESTSALKERMQKVINASKKLDDDLTAEDPKKQAMKEKLAQASKALEEETLDEVKEDKSELSDEELLAKRKAEYYAKKNQDTKKRLEEMKAKLNSVMSDEASIEGTEESPAEAPIEETSVETVSTETPVEEAPVEEVIAAKEDSKVEKVQETEPLKEDNSHEVGSAIVNNIVNEFRESEKAKEAVTEEVKEEAVEEKEALPELKEEKVKKHTKWHSILDFVIKTMNGMAHGLFATLIIGTIISTIGGLFKEDSNASIILINIGTVLKNLTGAGIGLGIAWSLGFKDLKLISLGAAGALAAYFCSSSAVTEFGSFAFQIGDPLTIYLIVIVVAILMRIVLVKKTPVDIIIVPLFTTLLAASLTLLVSKYTVFLTTAIGKFIGIATEYQPILMGIVIAVVMGMALTAPISSAAIAATIFTPAALEANEYVAIAGGAALIGCCVQMLGFMIQSRKDNGIGTFVAIGIGTSMLQFKNILRKPIIWLPTIITSAILGPISTTIIKMKCMGTAAGMGTSGLVGQIGFIASYGELDLNAWLILVGFQILAPIVLVFLIDLLFRKLKWIKDGDLKL
ncbi:MAG: PTS sugar transporter subunit IIC [Bacilli bacterium]|nr:PTS sugar transporter subunit IIC [Bacilli bacterium]